MRFFYSRGLRAKITRLRNVGKFSCGGSRPRPGINPTTAAHERPRKPPRDGLGGNIYRPTPSVDAVKYSHDMERRNYRTVRDRLRGVPRRDPARGWSGRRAPGNATAGKPLTAYRAVVIERRTIGATQSGLDMEVQR